LRNLVTIKFCTNGCRRLLVALVLAALAVPLFVASAYAQQDPYFDPSLGVGDSIIRSDVFVGDKQGRVTATEGLFTRQMSGWLSGGAEVLKGQVVPVGRGCNTDTYLANPAGKIALIERGVCTFVEKITKAYNAGAIGGIVYNNVRPNPADNDVLIRMGGCGDTGLPSCPGLVSIPGFFVGRTNGLILAATPVTVKVQAASFRALKDGVQALLASGILNRQQAGSLKDEISAASDAANRGDFATAVNLIEKFQADILALRDASVLPSADWLGLNDAANIIVIRLTSPFTSFTG
jgi:PA domain-containing protein